jgi:hypothetical protein
MTVGVKDRIRAKRLVDSASAANRYCKEGLGQQTSTRFLGNRRRKPELYSCPPGGHETGDRYI